MLLNFNSMKIIYSIALFFACFLNLNAQDIFEPSAEFFATGRFRFSDGNETRFQPPTTRFLYSSLVGNVLVDNYDYKYSYMNCSRQIKSILSIGSSFGYRLDSFVIFNGLITQRLRLEKSTLSSQFVEKNRDTYYYSSSATKPDSIITSPAVNNKKAFKIFTYDIPNRITIEIGGEDSLFKKTNLYRKTTQLTAEGHLMRLKNESFRSGNWVILDDEFMTWSDGKLVISKRVVGTSPLDTSYYRPRYIGATNKVDTFIQEYFDKLNGIYRPQLLRFLNTAQNVRGYPTKVLYQLNINNSFQIKEDWSFAYYSGDTLVKSKTIRNSSGIVTNLETYEYCGIPTLTPTAELQTLDFKIYPNPTNQVLNIEIPENTEGVSIEIINAMGIVMSKTIQLNVDVSTLPTGIYFVQIKTKDRVGVKRFVVNR
jgi:Secretion system C-terminal sorting domain